MIIFYTIAAAMILAGAGFVAGCLSDNKSFGPLFANAERINEELRATNKKIREDNTDLIHELMKAKKKLSKIEEVISD